MRKSINKKVILIDGQPLEELCYLYKNLRAERIVSGILKDVLKKKKIKKRQRKPGGR